ncbi:ferredoxin [Nonomuraea gerenzanensis]|uniref:ferredoxin n=1 Tax=Nonomuraea gerenzanensis TaxID=93944 RepID=UPI001CDA0F61|nr:ferredoxin [Nonomuraea gerenzanensis]UBU10220.1 ferredoxin [Nonomuraea gerenzanensis]
MHDHSIHPLDGRVGRSGDSECCGAGDCVLLAPEVFDRRDDDGIVLLRVPCEHDGQVRGVYERPVTW